MDQSEEWSITRIPYRGWALHEIRIVIRADQSHVTKGLSLNQEGFSKSWREILCMKVLKRKWVGMDVIRKPLCTYMVCVD